MSFFLRRKVNPRKVKIVSTVSVSVLITLIVFFLMSEVLRKSLKEAEKQYLENCNQVVQGYSSAIQYYLENYYTSLSSAFNGELFATKNKANIHKWLIENLKFLHKDFFCIFYIDENFKCYLSDGSVHDIQDKENFSPHNFDNADFYISDMVWSELVPEPFFMIEVPCFNESHELIGILCAAVEFSKLEKLTQEVKIGEQSTAYLQDRKGVLLDRPGSEYFGKVFVPKSEKYKHLSSDKTSSATEPGIIEVENYMREPIDLIYTKIKNCGWTLAVGFPKKYLTKIYNQQNFTKLMVILISIISLSLLVFLEVAISDYFYKNQLIDAEYDPVTNLLTRQKFEKESEKLMNKNLNGRFMLIESDIKGFKFINQNYGVEEADKIIFIYSKIISRYTREFHGISGHGYADHFYTFLRIGDLREAMQIFESKMEEIADMIRAYDIPFFPKFGVTFCKPSRTPGVTIKELIGQTSFVKNRVKDNMIVPYSVYSLSLFNKLKNEQFIESCMELALKNGEFFVMYQPKIRLADDKIVGAEALVRWKSPELGMLMPDKFIPLFERNGFIIKLDFYVYEQVFKFISSRLKSDKCIVPISVNMSRNHSKPEKFMENFMMLFNKYTIPPELVQVEIIERSFMDSSTLCDITNRLHEVGFSVAMDDFGTGESSLNMLTKIPVDVLKFDREFLTSSTSPNGELDEKSAKFIRSLIDLSRQLEKETVFEGVETEHQRNYLRSIKCDQVQGYFYSKPLTEEDFIDFMHNHI